LYLVVGCKPVTCDSIFEMLNSVAACKVLRERMAVSLLWQERQTMWRGVWLLVELLIVPHQDAWRSQTSWAQGSRCCQPLLDRGPGKIIHRSAWDWTRQLWSSLLCG